MVLDRITLIEDVLREVLMRIMALEDKAGITAEREAAAKAMAEAQAAAQKEMADAEEAARAKVAEENRKWSARAGNSVPDVADPGAVRLGDSAPVF